MFTCRYSIVDVARTHQSTLAVGICLGQLVIAAQSMTILSNLDISWLEPMRTLFTVVQVVSFKAELLNLSCFIEESNVITHFAGKLAIFPLMVLILLVVFFVMYQVFRVRLHLDNIINSVGMLFMVFFMTLTIVSLAPFQCLESPNGTESMSSNPSVLCNNNYTFLVMALMGAGGVLVYTVFFSAWVLYITIQYPKMVSSGQGARVIRRYRFLFQRFTSECYFYAPFYLLRSFLLAVLPVAFANSGQRQLIVFVMVLLMFGFPQALLKPWHGELSNLLDTIVTGSLVLVLTGAAVLQGSQSQDEATTESDIQIFFSIFMLILLTGFATITGYEAYRRFFPDPRFLGFLSHHKGGCAVGARFMKMELERLTRRKFFLDSDNLINIAFLLHLVRSASKNFVLLLSEDTLRRPWCAGEIATAKKNKVPVICVLFDDYKEATGEELTLEAISSAWTRQAFAQVELQGVTIRDVREAYLQIPSLPHVSLRRVCALGESVADLHGEYQFAVATVGNFCLGRRPPGRRSIDIDLSGLEVVIIGNCMDGEDVSRCLILSRQLQKVLLTVSGEVFRAEQVAEILAAPRHLLISLTPSILTSKPFWAALVAARRRWKQAKPILVRSPNFVFPTCEQIFGLGHPSHAELEETWKELQAVIAMPFTPEGHSTVMEAEVERLCKMMTDGQSEILVRSSSVLEQYDDSSQEDINV
jgi:hypothetical protein